MTPVAGALTITWLNQYVGPHRVCYRLVSAPPVNFTCITVNCPNPPGSSNTTTIPVLVDNESCDTLTWEVYVQAECEDINSTTGRVYVTPSPEFVPAPTCLPQTFTCTDVPVVGFTITNDGRNDPDGGGYNGTEVVTVGGDPATLVVGVGDPNDTLITNTGAGATPGVYLGVPANNITGSGVGATFDVTITGLGVIASVVSLGTGSGYAFNDTFNFVGGGITGLNGAEVIEVIESDLGTVLDITFVAPPPGLYLVPPAVVIAAPTVPGTSATATAVLGNCASGWDAGTNCLGDALGNYPIELYQGETIEICYDGGTYNGTDDLPADFGITLGSSTECCYDCVDINIENTTGDTIAYSYVDCLTKTISDGTLANGANIDITCVVNNSWGFDTSGVTVNTNTPPTCGVIS